MGIRDYFESAKILYWTFMAPNKLYQDPAVERRKGLKGRCEPKDSHLESRIQRVYVPGEEGTVKDTFRVVDGKITDGDVAQGHQTE